LVLVAFVLVVRVAVYANGPAATTGIFTLAASAAELGVVVRDVDRRHSCRHRPSLLLRPLIGVVLTALFGALAGVLFRAGSGAALQADALATPTCRQLHAWQWLGRWSGFTVCFGNDLVAHVNFPDELKTKRAYLNTFFQPTDQTVHF
jgi:hypothetical protein